MGQLGVLLHCVLFLGLGLPEKASFSVLSVVIAKQNISFLAHVYRLLEAFRSYMSLFAFQRPNWVMAIPNSGKYKFSMYRELETFGQSKVQSTHVLHPICSSSLTFPSGDKPNPIQSHVSIKVQDFWAMPSSDTFFTWSPTPCWMHRVSGDRQVSIWTGEEWKTHTRL